MFRFVRKPVDPQSFGEQVDAATAQHKLVTGDRELLASTVQGAVRAITGLVALTAVRERWEVEVAALLLPMGLVGLPTKLVERLPHAAAELLATIPRFEGVSKILCCQGLRFDGAGRAGTPRRGELPVGARILRIVSDFDLLQCAGASVTEALAELRNRSGCYDPGLSRSFEETAGFPGPGLSTVDVMMSEVELGMVFCEDIVTATGVLSIARGQDVTQSMVERIQSKWARLAAHRRVRMIVMAG